MTDGSTTRPCRLPSRGDLAGQSHRGTAPAAGHLLSALAVLLMLLVPVPAQAGTIQMVLATRVSTTPAMLRVELDLHNTGDEPALNVAPTLEFRGRITPGAQPIEALAPGAPMTVTFDLPVSGDEAGRGRWPVLIRVGYVDGSGYRFEAIHVDFALFGAEPDPSNLRLRVPDTHVESQTEVRLRVDRGDVDGPVRLAFATPAGVFVTPREIALAPGESGSALPLTLTSSGATLASRLPLVTIAEFDRGGTHDTVTAVSMIDIGPSPAGPRIQVVAVLFATALTTWVVIALVTARRRRSARDVR